MSGSPPLPQDGEACIQLAHGGGGTLMQQLIDQELRALYADPEQVLHDAASLALPHGRLAFSTDGYVVQPLEFPGGDIGRLAVVGTANDLAMAGARPLWISVALILEEGLPLALLRRLVASMAAAARECGVAIVTGDTKVVERGKADGLFITTSGIGALPDPAPGRTAATDPGVINPAAIRPGDQVLVSGDLGRHGVAILAARHGLRLEPPVLSDCAPLWPLVEQLLAAGAVPHCLRDLTRGGLASALQELALAAGVEIAIEEERLPVIPAVAGTCALLGFEPLHLANEGRLVAVVAPEQRALVEPLLEAGGGAWIGEVRPAGRSPRVLLTTALGTERLLLPLSGELLPRIC
ncbi:hydrogenase expression/formation protein HypE [Cyanobium sp. NIES-981]|uniref:hydrogenase expression/formation protein HypE n=1 Tax=Cyanobium sp. NIES-981 TaxID=1851505 RepID=UPI0007DCF670|nr:hydrogenase expression/formation protein HypE [Cyanobium sp. NIES-981]SBO43382.1 carbamoyl phosphate phosphatase, hydrogenase 3 maturation protein [Cyanobium sp. NIES-981]